ncbi:hypothetical protein EMIHUDRAFT_452547, partial [Emiliania huxleyi CCMP1516]|uniref:Uncharacterized protein n=2 Tax=Emiliania huxleyi TaxID=2903 RepID=A0A0D3IHX9_EMIH1
MSTPWYQQKRRRSPSTRTPVATPSCRLTIATRAPPRPSSCSSTCPNRRRAGAKERRSTHGSHRVGQRHARGSAGRCRPLTSPSSRRPTSSAPSPPWRTASAWPALFPSRPAKSKSGSRTNALGTLSSSRSTHVEGLPPPLPPPQPPLPPQPPPPPQWAGRLRRSRHCGSRRQCTRHCTSRKQRATAGRSRRRGGRPRCRRRRRRRRRLRRQRRRRRRRRRRKSSPWLLAYPHRRWMRRSQSLRGGRRCSRRPLRPLPSAPFGCPAASTPFRVYFL